MVFNVSIGFTNLKNKSAKEEANKSYGLFLGETIAIGDKDSAATVLTTSKKQMKNIGMFLKVEKDIFQSVNFVYFKQQSFVQKKL